MPVTGNILNLKEKIFKLEMKLLRPEIRKSREDLSKLIDDDFIEIGSSGKFYTKNDVIKELQDQQFAEIKISGFEIKKLKEDIVLAVYKSEKADPETGKIISARRSSVWKLNGENWQIVFHQGTPFSLS